MKKICILLVCCCLAMPLAAATKSSAKKATSSSKTAKKPVAKKSSANKKRTTTRRTRARRSGPPRQMAPTPERYMEIQRALSEKGYYDGPIDGKWSAECVAGLKRFQEDQNLAPDGKLGALSLIALGLGPKRESLPPQFDVKPEPTEDPN